MRSLTLPGFVRRLSPSRRAASRAVESGTLLCDYVARPVLKSVAVQNDVPLPPASVERVNIMRTAGVLGTKVHVAEARGETETSEERRALYEVELDWDNLLREVLIVLERKEALHTRVDRIEDPVRWLQSDGQIPSSVERHTVTDEQKQEAIFEAKRAEFSALARHPQHVLIESEWTVGSAGDGSYQLKLSHFRPTEPFNPRFPGDSPPDTKTSIPMPPTVRICAELRAEYVTPQGRQRFAGGKVIAGVFGWPARSTEGELYLEALAVFARIT